MKKIEDFARDSDTGPFRKSTPPGMVVASEEEVVVDPDLLKEAWQRNYDVQKRAIDAMKQARKDNRATRLLALGTAVFNVLIAILIVWYVSDVRRISIEAGAKLNNVEDLLGMVAESVVADNEVEISEVEAAPAIGVRYDMDPDLVASQETFQRRKVVRQKLHAQKKAVAVLERLASNEAARKSAVQKQADIQKKVDALDDTFD